MKGVPPLTENSNGLPRVCLSTAVLQTSIVPSAWLVKVTDVTLLPGLPSGFQVPGTVTV